MMGPKVGNESDQFFQTDRDIQLLKSKQRKQQELATVGSPIQCPSKILAFEIVDNKVAYVAQSGFIMQEIELQSGTVRKTFKGHNGPITSVCIIPGNRYCLTGSWDKTVKKWDLETQQCIFTLTGHTDFIKSIKTTNNHIYSSSTDGTIRFWDLQTGTYLGMLTGHTRSVEDLAIHPDQTILYSCSSDRTIRKWDLTKFEEVGILEGHETSVYGITPSWENDVLWSVSGDLTAIRWDLSIGVQDSSLKHPDFVKSIAILPNGYVATGCRDENIRIWDPSTETCVSVINAHFGEISCLKVSGSKLYSGSLDGTLRVWQLSDIIQPNLVQDASVKESMNEIEVSNNEQLMTEDEERELMELMNN